MLNNCCLMCFTWNKNKMYNFHFLHLYISLSIISETFNLLGYNHLLKNTLTCYGLGFNLSTTHRPCHTHHLRVWFSRAKITHSIKLKTYESAIMAPISNGQPGPVYWYHRNGIGQPSIPYLSTTLASTTKSNYLYFCRLYVRLFDYIVVLRPY